ncbi:hypothetical protein DIPPA_02140 [Diplonema papillatum]|nr:hypothetical protein DIPPA_02140 [Diplonema papillatum]
MSDSDSSSYYDDEFGRTREAIDREESEHGTPAADPEPAAAVSDRAGSSPSSAASRDGPAAAPAGTLLAGLQQVQQDPERHPLPADEFARKRDEASRSWATGPPTPAPASHTPPHTHAHHLRRRSSVGTTLRGSSTLSGDTGGAPCRRDPLLGISPDLEVADGFSAKVYGELLQAKKEVQLLVKEREALAAAARRLDKDLGAAEKRRRRAAAGWGAAAAAAADADSAASSLGPRHPLRARRGRAGKAGVVTAFAAACALVAIVVVRTGRHYAVVPPLQRAIYAANTTRTLACKQRLAGMMSELTQLCDTVFKAFSNFRFYEAYRGVIGEFMAC